MTAEDRWEDDYLHSTAAMYQAAHEAAYVQARADGVPAPDGWRRPHEPTCKVCSYVIVAGSCLGCEERTARALLSERAESPRGESVTRGLVDAGEVASMPRGPRSESDEAAAA